MYFKISIDPFVLMDKRTYTRLTRIEPFDGANGGWLVRRFYLISFTSIRFTLESLVSADEISELEQSVKW